MFIKTEASLVYAQGLRLSTTPANSSGTALQISLDSGCCNACLAVVRPGQAGVSTSQSLPLDLAREFVVHLLGTFGKRMHLKQTAGRGERTLLLADVLENVS